MPAINEHPAIRAYVSLSVLAEEILGLSRARVYELIERGALPLPCYELRTRRPVFSEEQQRQALAVRRSGLGIDGQPVVFYRRATKSAVPVTPAAAARRTKSGKTNKYDAIISSLMALGISTATELTVSTAMVTCFPNGTDGQAEADVLRVLFRHFRQTGGA